MDLDAMLQKLTSANLETAQALTDAATTSGTDVLEMQATATLASTHATIAQAAATLYQARQIAQLVEILRPEG